MSRPRVLVVDDEPGMLHAVRRVLEGRFDVVCSASPDEALDQVRRLGADVAILDIRMPEQDGFELMGRLKAQQPDLDVILMTGSLSEPDAHLIRAIREKAFYFVQKPFDREVLASLVERCLELRQLREENRRHLRRLERELAQARTFQQSLFPPSSRRLAGFRIEARSLPCVELGGDFFDHAPAGPGRAALLVADVSGHGASAAMLTAMVKAAFQSAHADQYRPLTVVQQIESGIRAFTDERFLSCFSARIDGGDGTLEYVNAGHPPALVRDPRGQVRQLGPTGAILSPALHTLERHEARDRLEHGDRLLLLTDGVDETPGAGDELFGRERIVRLLAEHGETDDVLDRILESLAEFSGGRPPRDDRTLLTLRFE